MTRLEKIEQLEKLYDSLSKELSAEGNKLSRLERFMEATPKSLRDYKQDFRKLPHNEQLIIMAQANAKKATIEILKLRRQMVYERKLELLLCEDK